MNESVFDGEGYMDNYERLKQAYIKLMSEYGDVYNIVKKKEDWKNGFKTLIDNDIPKLMTGCANIKDPYTVVGSHGKGRWTAVPWIAVFDTRITKSAQKGVYIVYLLNKDTKQLYLTLNQGATNVLQSPDSSDNKLTFTGVTGSSSSKNLDELRERAFKIRELLKADKFPFDSEIKTGAVNYDAGTIYYKKYTLDTLPSGEELIVDLLDMIDIYAKYQRLTQGGNAWLITWNPSNYSYTEYEEKRNQILTGEKYIDEWACANKSVNPGDRVYLMRIGSGTKNGIIASGYAASSSFMAPHYDPAKKAAGIEIPKIKVDFDHMIERNSDQFLKQDVLKTMFPNQQWSPMGSGIQIKDEYKDRLEQEWQKLINNQSETQEQEPEMNDEISVKDAVEQIKSYISNSGFTYEDKLIENFYLSLKSKPFVILAGTSGTGKTRLVKLFAQAINAKYKMIPVRPDWSDSTDLFGHLDLNGKYIEGEILPFIVNAKNDHDNPYILCLDEMNLARVEYYLSDFLSVIETRDFKDGQITSDPLVDGSRYGDDQTARSKYGEVRFPENLYLVGTVNMDETTFPFSKKVLDRANTIEFDNVDLTSFITNSKETRQLKLRNSFLKTKYLLLSDCKEEEDFVREINTELQQLNEILQTANAHVGYRVRDEIVFYMLNNKEAELLERDEAFDNEIMQKILPRIQGSSNSVRKMLCDLFKVFAGDYSGIQTETGDTASLMLNSLKKNKARYPKSAEKVAFMVRRFEEDGFTSYWL